MPKIKNVFLNKASVYLVGTLSTKMLNVLLVPIYAYFVSSEDLGDYDYVIAIANIITPIVYAVIWEAILRYCIRTNEKKDLEAYLSTAVLFFAMMNVAAIVVVFVISFFYKDIITLVLIMSFILVYGAASMWQYATRSLGENKRYVVAGISGSATFVVCNILFIAIYKLNYLGLSVSQIISQLVIVVVLESKVHLISRCKTKLFSKTKLKEMLAFSIPLVINNISLWIYLSGNKVIIQNFIGVADNGLYSFASRFSILISLFSTVISMAVIEESYSFNTLEEYKNRMSKLITIISKGYFSLSTLALPAIYILYTIAFKNTEYYSSSNYIYLLLLSALFTALSNNFGSSFQVTNNTKYISITTIMGAVVALVLSLLLVKPMGIYGVLIGGTIGPLVMMQTRAIYAKKSTGLALNWFNNIVILIVGVLVYFVLMTNKSLLVQTALFFAVAVFLIFEYRNEIRLLLSVMYKSKGD